MKTICTGIALAMITMQISIAQIVISWPISNSVFQRDGSGSATVILAGQWMNSASPSELQWRIIQLNVQNNSFIGVVRGWEPVWDSGQVGLFKMTATLSGGWYAIEIAHVVNGQTQQFASRNFGVGEVFVIAGQSNAQGYPEVTTTYNGVDGQPYEGVVADLHIEHPELNGGCLNEYPAYPLMSKLTVGSPIAPQGRNNWCYTVLGNKLVDQFNVPIAFFNAARGNSNVTNWSVSANNNPTEFDFTGGQICSQVGQPYAGLRRTLNFYGSVFGTRGILWHQGENDAHRFNTGNQTGSQYRDQLRFVINKSRTDFNHGDLNWWICKATQQNDSQPAQSVDIRNAQGEVQTDSYNKSGPNTDDYVTGYRASDLTHFSGNGLQLLGNIWKNDIANVLTSAQPVSANQLSDVFVSYLGGNTYRLTVPLGEQQYFWTTSGSTLNENNPTNNYIDVSAGGSYQCYTKTFQGSGNIKFSQSVYLPFSGGFRTASKHAFSEENYGFSLNVYPNPVVKDATILFKIPVKAFVRLEVIDQTGRSLHTIATKQYDAGAFKQTVNLSNIPDGIYLCRITVNDVFITKKLVKTSD